MDDAFRADVDFIALDVETANENYSSLCQIGIVYFSDGQVVDKWETYVNPKTYFVNTWLHGIDEETVKDAPLIPEAIRMLADRIQDKPVVHHTHFDRVAIQQACLEHDLDCPLSVTLDSARILRRVNQKFLCKGYALANACGHYGIDTEGHHNAVRDAEMAGLLVSKLLAESNTEIYDWVEILKKSRITARDSSRIRMEGAQGMPLSGKTIVFTGTLSQPRTECANMAAGSGLNVWDRVTVDTDYLVVGIPAHIHLKDNKPSTKQKTAMKLIDEGSNIQILSEDEFLALLDDAL